HVQFANATSDEKLVKFVKHFGPVWGNMPAHLPSNTRIEPLVRVEEDLQGLRRERALIAAVMHLAGILILDSAKERPTISQALSEIATALFMRGPNWEYQEPLPKWYGVQIRNVLQDVAFEFDWPVDTPINQFLRTLNTHDLRIHGSRLLCAVLNVPEFRPTTVFTANYFTELPRHDRKGVLPALYFMLRQDVLYRKGLAICRLADCGAFFRIERFGQRFCSERCSRLHRQRDYWAQKGKKLRKKRVLKNRRDRQRR